MSLGVRASESFTYALYAWVLVSPPTDASSRSRALLSGAIMIPVGVLLTLFHRGLRVDGDTLQRYWGFGPLRLGSRVPLASLDAVSLLTERFERP